MEMTTIEDYIEKVKGCIVSNDDKDLSTSSKRIDSDECVENVTHAVYVNYGKFMQIVI